jgi:hypothetical protein
MMRAFVFAMLISLGFLSVSATAVRRGALREQAALMWLLVGCAMVLISGTLPLHLLNRVAGFVGIAYAPDLLLLVAVVFLVVLVFYLSITVARLREEHRILVEEFAVAMARSPRKEVGAGDDMRSGTDTTGEASGFQGSPDAGNGEEDLPGSAK